MHILRERFGDTCAVVQDHLKQVLKLSCQGSSVSDLRHFYDQLLTHTRSLEALGVDPNRYEVMLISTVLDKLPRFFKQSVRTFHPFRQKLF